MNLWDRLRTVLLISTFGTTVFVFGKSVLAPAPKKIVTQQYTFPPEVPLAGWQQVETDRLLNPTPVTTIEETNSVDVRSPETRTVDQPVEAKIPLSFMNILLQT